MVLPYSPYVTSYDRIVDLDETPDTRTFNSGTYNDMNVLVIGRRNVIDQRRGLCFFDCKSVTIIGGHFEPPVNGFPINSGGGVAPGTLSFQGCGSVYLEGVVTDNKNLIVTDANIASMGANGGDAIYFSGGNSRSRYLNGNFTAQNCCFLNVRGVQTTPGGSVKAHGDVFQTGSNTQGKAGHVRFYNITASCDYQGFFLDPQKASAPTSTTTYYAGGNAGVTFNRVNIKRSRDPGADYRLIFLFSAMDNYNTRGYPVTFNEFYVEGPNNEPVEQMVFPFNEASSYGHTDKYQAKILTEGGRRYATYPGLTDAGKVVSGRIWQGAPAGGDFITPAQVGRNYTQGTDFTQTTTPVTPTPTPTPTTDPIRSPVNLLAVGSGSWTTGGPGTVTTNAATGAITIITDGSAATYARRSVTTEIGKKYALSWSLDTALVTFRTVGTGAGLSDLLSYNPSSLGDNYREFTATTTTTWVEFSRSTAATGAGTTTSNFILEKVPESGRLARRLNGRNQFFSLDAQQSSLRIANSNFFIGGLVNLTYMPASTIYFSDFGRFDPASTAGGASRIRLFYDVANSKVAFSTSDIQGSNYRESFIVSPLKAGTWYFVGGIVKANGDVQLVLDKRLATEYVGTTIPPLYASDICRVLHIGARVVNPQTNLSPARFADWIWCSNWLPTTAQLNSLADGVRPNVLNGFVPPAGANLYHWPMEAASGNELTVAGTTELIANPTAGTPGIVGGLDVGAPVLPNPEPSEASFPLDIIIL